MLNLQLFAKYIYVIPYLYLVCKPMKFIKRFLFITFLLVIAFFIYRVINPSWAKALLHDLKSFSNDKIGTHFSLTGTLIQNTWSVLQDTWVVAQDAGVLIPVGEGLQEFTGTDSWLLLDAVDPSQENFTTSTGNAASSETPPPMPVSSSQPVVSAKTSSSSSSSVKGLSSQDMNDAKNLLKNFQ